MKIICSFTVSSFALLVISGCTTGGSGLNRASDQSGQASQLKEHALSSAEQSASFQNGRRVYQGTCIACHGDDGRGALPGVPDLTRVEGFTPSSHDDFALFKHVKHVEYGLKKPGDPLAMPPKGGNPNLTEKDIKDVLIYMRAKFLDES